MERHAELDEVLIGGPEKRRVEIVDYDPGWPVKFQAHRDRVRRALGGHAIRVEHIGSTVVPGLVAKPIIDMLVTVDDPDEHPIASALASAGYQLRVREPRHRMFRTPDLDVHVHVWAQTDREVSRYLRFRDRLRRSRTDRARYEQLKRELAAREWSDMKDYADAKDPLIKSILADADQEP